MTRSARRFGAVLFDFDGTLTRPDALDFPALRDALGCPPATLILEYIDALPTEEERATKRKILSDFEMAAARASVPNEGAEETVRLLKEHGVAVGILTRNTRSSVLTSLANFPSLRESDFAIIVTRESGGRPKPHPDGVLAAAHALGVEAGRMLVVGDFIFDIVAGQAAGAATALVTNGGDSHRATHAAFAADTVPDFTIQTLRELPGIVDGDDAD